MYYNVGIVHKYNLLHIRKYQAEIWIDHDYILLN